MTESKTEDLKKLGSATIYSYTGADEKLLERFPNPMKNSMGMGRVLIRQPEFTSLCPMTGQPDFATIVIEYEPKEHCVESKSLKLYLGSFRQVGEFHEACVAKIHHDLMMLLDPRTLLVRGEFTPRGGIPFWPEIKYPR
jgi:7-cyano-7-deazaguanine reductase